MKIKKPLSLVTFLFATISFLALAAPAFAHQPVINVSTTTQVVEPEISKAYYGKLDGSPHFYEIDSTKDFYLYVNILVPDISEQKKDFSALVYKLSNGKKLLKNLDGTKEEWKAFFEPFGHDSYWQGPEYASDVKAGKYEVVVNNPGNKGKYALAVGKIEDFSFFESLSTIKVIPKLKTDFFNVSPATFIFSPLAIGYIVIMFILAFIFGFVYRFVLKNFAKGSVRGVEHNIGKSDRSARLAIGIVLFLWAIFTNWSPVMLFFSGFAFFEAIFNWCGFYAAIGRNTCPI